MDAFLHDTDVTLSVVLADASGNALAVDVVEYSVVDETDAELIARDALAGFAAGSSTAEITVAAANNALPAGASRALRVVDLFCKVGGNWITLRQTYAIQQADPLVAGVNSFQTLASAEFVALDIPNLDGWNNASDSQRAAALIDARSHILQLSFRYLNRRLGQNYLDYIPEGVRYVGNDPFGFSGSLTFLTADQFKALPVDLLAALRKAQVAEANVILGGDPVEAKRADGILLDSVGESRQMFRNGTPLKLPVSRRALAFLSDYVTFSKMVGRG